MKIVTIACRDCGVAVTYSKGTGQLRQRCAICRKRRASQQHKRWYVANRAYVLAQAAARHRAMTPRTRSEPCPRCGETVHYEVVKGRRRLHCAPCRKEMRLAVKARYREGNREKLRAAGRLYVRRRYRNDLAYQKRAKERILAKLAARRAALYERDQGVCHLCGRHVPWDEFELDHRVPVARGGGHGDENLATAHRLCNRRKGARLPEEMMA